SICFIARSSAFCLASLVAFAGVVSLAMGVGRAGQEDSAGRAGGRIRRRRCHRRVIPGGADIGAPEPLDTAPAENVTPPLSKGSAACREGACRRTVGAGPTTATSPSSTAHADGD